MMANRLRDLTSSRASVRRNIPRFRGQTSCRARPPEPIALENGRGVTASLQNPRAYLEIVRSQHQDRIVELARHRQRPPFAPSAWMRCKSAGCRVCGAWTVSVAVRAVGRCAHPPWSSDSRLVDLPLERCQAIPLPHPDGHSRPPARGPLLRSSLRTVAAWRGRLSDAIPWRAGPRTPSPLCRRYRRDRGVLCAYPSGASVRRCRAEPRAAGSPAGSPPRTGHPPG